MLAARWACEPLLKPSSRFAAAARRRKRFRFGLRRRGLFFRTKTLEESTRRRSPATTLLATILIQSITGAQGCHKRVQSAVSNLNCRLRGGRGAAGDPETIPPPSDTKTHGAGGPRADSGSAAHTPGRRRVGPVSGAMKAVKAKSPLSTSSLNFLRTRPVSLSVVNLLANFHLIFILQFLPESGLWRRPRGRQIYSLNSYSLSCLEIITYLYCVEILFSSKNGWRKAKRRLSGGSGMVINPPSRQTGVPPSSSVRATCLQIWLHSPPRHHQRGTKAFQDLTPGTALYCDKPLQGRDGRHQYGCRGAPPPYTLREGSRRRRHWQGFPARAPTTRTGPFYFAAANRDG